jgi:hypothetical protein
MKMSKASKILLIEMEVLSLLFIIILSVIYNAFYKYTLFYLLNFLLGFAFYFLMIYEEKIHKKNAKKHDYFEHTSSFIMIAQTGLGLGFLFVVWKNNFLAILFFIIAIIMQSVSISRMLLFKKFFSKK